MSRKDTLKTMLTRRAEASAATETVERPSPSHMMAGAVGAMSRSLGHITDAAERARALIANGDAVVEIPTERLVASFVRDRLAVDDRSEEYEALLQAIREVGQRSPILVRPLPDRPGFYQIVFGHRRAQIARALGKPVKAVVQTLDDDEVVVVQGQENAVRKDLSFIERALFAEALEARGFSRDVIMSALGASKSRVSELLSLARAISTPIIEAIGPAPKKGRPKWQALAERIATPRRAGDVDPPTFLAQPAIVALNSDDRFEALFATLSRRDAQEAATHSVVNDAGGAKIARLVRAGARLSVILDDQATPEFGAFLASRLPDIYRQFQRQKRKGGASD
jgi:ParB family chromosome partitioning protein